MPDPEIQEPTEFQYYVQREGIRRDYSRPSHQELIRDVNVLHGFMKNLVREKDRMQETVASQRTKIWILTATVAAEFTVIGWLVKAFLERFH